MSAMWSLGAHYTFGSVRDRTPHARHPKTVISLSSTSVFPKILLQECPLNKTGIIKETQLMFFRPVTRLELRNKSKRKIVGTCLIVYLQLGMTQEYNTLRIKICEMALHRFPLIYFFCFNNHLRRVSGHNIRTVAVLYRSNCITISHSSILALLI